MSKEELKAFYLNRDLRATNHINLIIQNTF